MKMGFVSATRDLKASIAPSSSAQTNVLGMVLVALGGAFVMERGQEKIVQPYDVRKIAMAGENVCLGSAIAMLSSKVPVVRAVVAPGIVMVMASATVKQGFANASQIGWVMAVVCSSASPVCMGIV